MFMKRRLYCKLHGLVSCLIKEQLQAMEVFQQADASRQKSSSAGPKLTFQFLCDDSSTLPLDAHTEPAARMPRPERPVYVCTYMFILL